MMKKRFDLIAYSYPSTLLDLTESTVKCVYVKKQTKKTNCVAAVVFCIKNIQEIIAWKSKRKQSVNAQIEGTKMYTQAIFANSVVDASEFYVKS